MFVTAPKARDRLAKTALDREAFMNRFDTKTISAMRTVLEEVCSHIPTSATSARTIVATKILDCASNGERSYEGLMAAGRRAVIDQFGNVDVVRGIIR